MRRQKRAVFPFFLFLCLVLVLLVGVRQHFSDKHTAESLHTVLDRILPGNIQESSSSETDISRAEESLPSPEETSIGNATENTGLTQAPDSCFPYYYQQLSESEQRLYHQLYTAVAAREEKIMLDTTDTDTVYRVFHFVLYDHPELFWCTGSSQSIVHASETEFMPDYSCSPEEISKRTAEIEAQAASCLSGINTDASDYEKVRYIYTWLVNTVAYDENASDNQNIYSSLAGHASVCAGYAKGMQYLLNRLSVPCIYITGTLAKGGSHAWNMVRCDDSWYQVDSTFGDPVFANTEDIPADNLSYAYLCCTDAQIRSSHIPDGEVSYPSCSSMDLNYYALNGWFIWSYDEQTLREKISAAVADGKDSFTLQCANSDTYRQVCDGLLDTIIPDVSQTYMERHHLKQVNYKYSKDADMLVFSLYWTSE